VRQASPDLGKSDRRHARGMKARSLYREGSLTGPPEIDTQSRLLEVDGQEVLFIVGEREWARPDFDARLHTLADSVRVGGLILDLRSLSWNLAWDHRTQWVRDRADLLLGVFGEVPLVGLIGEFCEGAGADLALALKGRQGVILVGTPTGSPSIVKTIVQVPAGFTVEYPAFRITAADGSVVGAATGVPPDELVLPGADDDKDPVFERGLQVLKKALVR